MKFLSSRWRFSASVFPSRASCGSDVACSLVVLVTGATHLTLGRAVGQVTLYAAVETFGLWCLDSLKTFDKIG